MASRRTQWSAQSAAPPQRAAMSRRLCRLSPAFALIVCFDGSTHILPNGVSRRRELREAMLHVLACKGWVPLPDKFDNPLVARQIPAPRFRPLTTGHHAHLNECEQGCQQAAQDVQQR